MADLRRLRLSDSSLCLRARCPRLPGAEPADPDQM